MRLSNVRTQTHTAAFVSIYRSSSHIDDNKGRKAESRMERVRGRKGDGRKEESGREKERNGAEGLRRKRDHRNLKE